MLNNLSHGSFLWTRDLRYTLCKGNTLPVLCAVYVWVSMSVHVDICACICDCKCLCVKECAADTFFGHVTFDMVSCVCVGVNESLVSMAPLHSCVLSMMLQQQFRLNLSCCGSAWEHRWALDTSAQGPRGPGNLSESHRSRFNLTGHVLNIPSITPALPGNHRHCHGLLFAWWPQRDNPIGWAQCQNKK